MRISILLPLFMVVLFLQPAATARGAAIRGEGDFEFYVDVTPIPIRGEETLALIQIAIPLKEIEYAEKENTFQAAVRISIELRSESERVFRRQSEARDTRDAKPHATDLSGFLALIDSFLVHPGRYELDVKVEDLNRRKKTLFGMLSKSYLNSALQDVFIEVPSFSSDALTLSEPLLIWSRDGGGGYIPNPMRIYGLKNDTLSYLVSALVPEQLMEDSLDIWASVRDQEGTVIDSSRSRVGAEGGRVMMHGVFDVNTYPAGSYQLSVESSVGGSYASVGKDFNVAWELINWQKQARDLLIEGLVVLPENEYMQFKQLGRGDQERILNEYWKKMDPTPHTALNETYEKFVARLNYVDRQYGGLKRGALTDMGQIFIRFGPPDDKEVQQVPWNRMDVYEALEKLSDQYEVVIHGAKKEGPSAQRITVIDQQVRQRMDGLNPFRGEGGMDTGAYELWIYNLKGDPILMRDKLMTIGSGLRYLFIDKDGYGEYSLVGSSEEIENYK
jgi:GWxTD domain-containing protein